MRMDAVPSVTIFAFSTLMAFDKKGERERAYEWLCQMAINEGKLCNREL